MHNFYYTTVNDDCQDITYIMYTFELAASLFCTWSFYSFFSSSIFLSSPHLHNLLEIYSSQHGNSNSEARALAIFSYYVDAWSSKALSSPACMVLLGQTNKKNMQKLDLPLLFAHQSIKPKQQLTMWQQLKIVESMYYKFEPCFHINFYPQTFESIIRNS